MREITIETLSSQPEDTVNASQKEKVVVTRNGKPVAIVVGIENKDEEQWRLQTSPEFWRMIEERRKETKFATLDEVKAELEADELKETRVDQGKD